MYDKVYELRVSGVDQVNLVSELNFNTHSSMRECRSENRPLGKLFILFVAKDLKTPGGGEGNKECDGKENTK